MINQQLREYIEQNILPEYNKNEQGHGVEHIKYVVRRSLEFAKLVEGINLDMVYTIACYHDIGHHIDAKNHEQISAQILADDENIYMFFTSDQIDTMVEAVEDHRASSNNEPRSIYGKIVSSADRRTDMNNVLTTMYSYRSKHSPEFTIEENIEEAYNHLCKKFSKDGYEINKMYFKDEEHERMLEEADYFANHKPEFVKRYCEINQIANQY